MSERAQSLEQAIDLEGGDGHYSIRLSEAWEIWGPSGGYLAAIALAAAGRSAQIRRPASFYCHFLSSPDFEHVDLAVEVLRRGRRSEALSVKMTQGAKPVLFALVRTVEGAPGYRHQESSAPEITRPEDLASPLSESETANRSLGFGTTSAAAGRSRLIPTTEPGPRSGSGCGSSQRRALRTRSLMPPARSFCSTHLGGLPLGKNTEERITSRRTSTPTCVFIRAPRRVSGSWSITNARSPTAVCLG